VVVTQTETAQPKATVTDGQVASADSPTSTESAEEGAVISNPSRWWYFLFDHAQYDALSGSYGNS
jgi:hypothetical protein